MKRESSLPRLFVAALLAGVCHGQAAAGPPLITDDPGTPGDGKWEVNAAFVLERSREERVIAAPTLDVNYGVGDHLQLKYEVALLAVDRDGEDARVGVGNSEIGLKWRFLDEDRHGVSASVYPKVEFNNPTDSVRRGVVESGTHVLLPFQFAKTVGPVEVFGEAGYQFVQHEEDLWIYGLAVAYPLSQRLELLAEVHGTVEQDFDDHEPLVNAGLAWGLSEHTNLLLSIGRGLRDRDKSPDLLLYAGVQFNF